MFELVPPDLDRNGLARAIKGTADVVLADAGVRVEVHDELVDAPDLAVQTVAYRIAQEALTNVRNHAGATEVVIDLRDGDGGIRLEISDNGQGVSAARLLDSHRATSGWNRCVAAPPRWAVGAKSRARLEREPGSWPGSQAHLYRLGFVLTLRATRLDALCMQSFMPEAGSTGSSRGSASKSTF